MSHVGPFLPLRLCFALSLCGISLPLWAVDAPGLYTHQSYTESVKTLCYAKWESAAPWNSPIGSQQEIPKDLIVFPEYFYPDIYDANADKKFREGIDAIKADPLEIQGIIALESQNLPLASQIEKASLVYKERMNALYACAVLNTKYKIHTRLVKEFHPEGTNMVRNLERATQQIESQMKQRGCKNVSKEEGDGAELSMKRSLIRSATMEYCNYRHYLKYVDDNVKNQLSRVIQNEDKLRAQRQADPNAPYERFPSSESLAASLGSVSSRATNEIAHTQRVFDDAFDAYRDFEQTYASHILMVLIEDRYLMIREYLRDTMNPIGQVIYKASNASSKGK